VRVRADSFHVHDERRPKQHVRDRDQGRSFIDRGYQAVFINANAVVRRHHDHLRSKPRRKTVIHVSNRRKIEFRHDDPIPRCRVLDRRYDGGLTE
jgi:hypothetical protein